MAKHKFTTEFEINASKKMLYPYLASASGLSQWFADDVNINEDKVFNFIWDGQDHRARMTTHKVNSFVKYELLENGHVDNDPNYYEFKLEMNELTQSVFLKITDYSENDDEEELEDLWSNLVVVLREIVGG
ncbi:MAG: START-like domain-containing protein [Bacteroidota bacterium]|nr:START-like domain-containing protein [Bacteroidota bacterium]